MNIGSIKRMLQGVGEDKDVYFDFCDCVPTEIHSWRGIYAQPPVLESQQRPDWWRSHGTLRRSPHYRTARRT